MSIENSYIPGNIVTLTVLFTDNASPPNPADPTTVTLRITDPTGAESDYTGSQLTKISTGSYSFQQEVLLTGWWNYRWEGIGAITAANEKRFNVQDSAFLNPQ
jgi:uncharacterized protein YfaS (alpha-2-macroglobulin family)